MYKPRAWQERDLNFLAPMPHSANWSQMGCFKTSTGLWLMERKKVKNALIITSKVGKGAYFADFYKCLPKSWELYNLNIHDLTRRIEDYEEKVPLDEMLTVVKSGLHNHPIVFLAHYDVFTTAANESSRKRNGGVGTGILDKLNKIKWDFILCDEAHRLKNPKAQWTRNIKRLKAHNRHAMTGTAFVNNPAELWSILNWLNSPEWTSYWAFLNYFCDTFIDTRGFTHIRGLKKDKVAEFRRLRERLGPRHTMARVHRGITKPIETHHEVELKQTQRRMYNDIKSVLQTMDQQGATLSSPNVLSQLNRLRQITVATPQVNGRAYVRQVNRVVTDVTLVEPSTKLDQVMEILKELDEDEQKVVVFSNFKDPLDLLQKRLDDKNIGYVRMLQSDNENVRYDKWSRQFRLPEKKVFLSTLALGGESINLTCAQYLIFLDRSWSPKDMLQAVGRVYRPGQEGAVEVIHINARNTTDAYVLSKLNLKQRWFEEIFGD